MSGLFEWEFRLGAYKSYISIKYEVVSRNVNKPLFQTLKKEIEKAKRSPSFPREYELQYQGLIGNVFSTLSIENCQKISYNPLSVIPNCKVSIRIDPSFGSSKFGICVTRFVNERIEVIEAEEYERPDFNGMINRVWQVKQQHRVDNNNLTI